MAFHVPFSQRPSGRQPSQPVYIGFEPPRRPRRHFNWWGFNGVFLFFISLGILSPIALLVSLVGLKQKPRRLAVVGTALSLIGTLLMAAIVANAVAHEQRAAKRQAAQIIKKEIKRQIDVCQGTLAEAATEFEQFQKNHDGQLPADLDGNALVLKYVDPWKNELMYEVNADSVNLRSAGPDSKFFSSDDITYRIQGVASSQSLLTMGL